MSMEPHILMPQKLFEVLCSITSMSVSRTFLRASVALSRFKIYFPQPLEGRDVATVGDAC